MTVARFVKLRLARLYPAIFVGALLGTLVLLVRVFMTHSLTYSRVLLEGLSGLLLLPIAAVSGRYPENESLFLANPPLWSLFFELIINVVYALLVSVLTTGRIWLICIVSAAALVYVALLHNNITVGSDYVSFLPGFIRVTCPFFIGVLLSRYKPLFAVSNKVGIILLITLAVVLLNTFRPDERVYAIVATLAVFPVTIYLGAAARSSQITRTICLFLEELSYPLYVIHHPVVRIVLNGTSSLHLALPHWMTALLCIVASVTAALALLFLWDRPIRMFLKRDTSVPLRT
jgi:peptidoglycan/LPS O-acetylase OafA/YrhL